MSLIPRNNTSNSPTPYTPFPRDFWDTFPTHFSFPFPFPSFPFHYRTVPYSELSLETSGNVRARLECKEIDEAHLIVADLPGFQKHEVEVKGEDGGFVTVSSCNDGRFFWRVKLGRDANIGVLSWSLENGVLTVLVPKFGVDSFMGLGWGDGNYSNGSGRDVRQIEIEGSDD